MASVSPIIDAADYWTYAEELRKTGVTVLPPFLMFNMGELDQIVELQLLLPEEKVIRDHDVYVRRVLIDENGSLPQLREAAISSRIVALLADSRRAAAFSSLFRSDEAHYIRRCQINRMVKGSFIKRHLDTDANPDYEYSAILLLGHEFKGGEFVICPETEDEKVLPALKRGSVLIISCAIRHCVRPVMESERKSLAWFYSRSASPNRSCSVRILD